MENFRTQWIFTSIAAFIILIMGLALLITINIKMNQGELSPKSTSKRKTNVALPSEIIEEIWAHKDDANAILEYVLKGDGKNLSYNKLAELTDTFGQRMVGTDQLEQSIDYVMAEMRKDGFENVHGEPFMVPHWIRGEEKVTMVRPRNHDMSVLGLGFTVGTNGTTVKADVIVVESFDELDAQKDKVPGKIVVYNQPYYDYGQSVQYRSQGASRASQYGAVAALVRSVTGYSIYSPHTGMQSYWSNVPQIPCLCITVEDAELLHRLHKRGENITIEIMSTSRNNGVTETRNLVGELIGSEIPEETVIIGGHIDSWDVGTGAMDDAGGVVISLQAVNVLKTLGLTPKRTIRVIGWSAEEIGLLGGKEYYLQHQNETNSTSLIIESDSGLWKPLGMGIAGTDYTMAIIEEILQLVSVLNATSIFPGRHGPDIGDWVDAGVPGGDIATKNDQYFHYHHSHGDTMTMIDPNNLDLCTVVWSVVAYVTANLKDKLPRDELPPPAGVAASMITTYHIYIVLATIVMHRIFVGTH